MHKAITLKQNKTSLFEHPCWNMTGLINPMSNRKILIKCTSQIISQTEP